MVQTPYRCQTPTNAKHRSHTHQIVVENYTDAKHVVDTWSECGKHRTDVKPTGHTHEVKTENTILMLSTGHTHREMVQTPCDAKHRTHTLSMYGGEHHTDVKNVADTKWWRKNILMLNKPQTRHVMVKNTILILNTCRRHIKWWWKTPSWC